MFRPVHRKRPGQASAASRSGARPHRPEGGFRPRRPEPGEAPRPRAGARAPRLEEAEAPRPRAGARAPRPEEAEAPRPRAGVRPRRPEASEAPRPRAAAASAPGARPRPDHTGPWAPAHRPRPARTHSQEPGQAPAKKPARPAKAAPRPAGERLQKILAAAGVASRRSCEDVIREGRVQVNGVTVTELGTRADPERDQITVDFRPIAREQLVYLLLNKPKGYVTSVKDEAGRPTVMALVHGVDARVYPVGRLDFNSEGLLLLTNDGELAQRLMAPEFHVAKVYLVKVHRMPKPETLDEFRQGFRLDGRKLKPCGIEVVDRTDNPWLKVTLVEGKNQQIRRMFAAVGHPVAKLKRIQFGPLADPALKPGAWRFCTPQEMAALKAL